MYTTYILTGTSNKNTGARERQSAIGLSEYVWNQDRQIAWRHLDNLLGPTNNTSVLIQCVVDLSTHSTFARTQPGVQYFLLCIVGDHSGVQVWHQCAECMETRHGGDNVLERHPIIVWGPIGLRKTLYRSWAHLVCTESCCFWLCDADTCSALSPDPLAPRSIPGHQSLLPSQMVNRFVHVDRMCSYCGSKGMLQADSL